MQVKLPVMNKRLLILLLIVFATITLGIAMVINKAPQKPVSGISVIPSPTATPDNEDKKLLQVLSKELAAKYFTYARPDSDEYLASIKPYVTKDFYSIVADDNKRYGDRLTDIAAIKSMASDVSVDIQGSQNAVTTTHLNTAELNSERAYNQVLELHWVKRNGKWSADRIVGDQRFNPTDQTNRQQNG